MSAVNHGKPHDALAEVNETGKFVRTAAGFREIISVDHPVFKPEAGRYHLYISCLSMGESMLGNVEVERLARCDIIHVCPPHLAKD